jgi:GT2 family glycosyltransferase
MATPAKEEISSRTNGLPTPIDERVKHLEESLAEYKRLLLDARLRLAAIHGSHWWKVLPYYYSLRHRVFPDGSCSGRIWNGLMQALVGSAKWLRRAWRRSPAHLSRQYGRWIRKHEPSREELETQRQTTFARMPRISVILPVEGTLKFLRATIESVLGQTYCHWELCIVAGSDPTGPARALLDDYARREPRIRVVRVPADRGLSSLNEAVAVADGAYLTLLGRDDTLAPFALFEVVRAINDTPAARLLYSDEDLISETGRTRLLPQFKPDWSPDLLCSTNYLGHLTVIERALFQEIGGFRPGFDDAPNYDLALRASERAGRAVHIPRVLYHRRHSNSALPVTPNACESGRKALTEHLVRLGLGGDVRGGAVPGTYEVRHALAATPQISIVIPNRDTVGLLRRCIASIQTASYPNWEVLVVENHSEQPETFAYYRELAGHAKVRVLHWTAPYNFAAVNNFAAAQAAGDVLLFLNNDTEALHADWLERLLEHALRPAVGAVGAKLYYPDGTIQHGGIVLGSGGTVGHAHRLFPGKSDGYCQRLVCAQNVSAVTGACLMMRQALFEEVNGFDTDFRLHFNDVDLCLKLRDKGYRIVWTPHARLRHYECKTSGRLDTPAKRKFHELERELFQAKWRRMLAAGDPYYSPHVNLEDEVVSLR